MFGKDFWNECPSYVWPSLLHNFNLPQMGSKQRSVVANHKPGKGIKVVACVAGAAGRQGGGAFGLSPKMTPIGYFCAFCWLILLGGCSGGGGQVQPADMANIKKIASAYLKATDKLGRPPKEKKELVPYLKDEGDLEALFQSPNDGQPFVIIWGTNPRAGLDVSPGVIAYEKVGRGGKRFVFTAMGVMQMADEDFAKANFPKGHKPF